MIRPVVTIRMLEGWSELQACVALQKETWGPEFSEKVPASVLLSALHVGGVVAGAFGPDHALLGFVFGLTGEQDGCKVHWSDMLAVSPTARNAGIGVALKLWQREYLLEHGVERISWTFDPLESRNAHVNFARLGGEASRYLRDCYGESDSPLHRGLGTDRLVLDWWIRSERVRDRVRGESLAPGDLADAQLVNPPQRDGPLLVPGEAILTATGRRLRLAIPPDIQAIRDLSPVVAAAWRHTTRIAFEHYLAAGYVVRELAREGEWSSYGLERKLT